MSRTLTRRTLVAGAAWAVPTATVVGAAPAVAASYGGQSATYSMTLKKSTTGSNYVRASSRSGSGTATTAVGAKPVTCTVTSTGATGAFNNLVAVGDTINGHNGMGIALASDGLQLQQTSNTALGHADRQSVTFTFSRPVYNLTLTMLTLISSAVAITTTSH